MQGGGSTFVLEPRTDVQNRLPAVLQKHPCPPNFFFKNAVVQPTPGHSWPVSGIRWLC